MKFTVLSHAGLYVEHEGVRLVTDPWLIGSCYWRSWWNFPEPPLEMLADLKPDFIYLTHLHWDHFHGASLRRFFPRSTPILIPRVATRRMQLDLQWLGFSDITEIPHAAALRLGPDFVLRSYQSGLCVDSALLLRGGGVTIFNCNDCKLFGLPLAQILDEFPKIDFVLRSHSSASPIPYCVEDYAEKFPQLRTQQDYIEEFSRFATYVGARYAVPFASNHCFLHRDTVQFNRTAVSPNEVERQYRRVAEETGSGGECIVMSPGSSWSQAAGFNLIAFDYANRNTYIEHLSRKHDSELRQQYAREAQTYADFEAFSQYFLRFMRAVPAPVRWWLKLRITFHVQDPRGDHYWLVDLAAVKLEILAKPKEGCVLVRIPAIVLNDCTKINMFSVWGPSKRLGISLPTAPQLSDVTTLFTLLDFFELDMLPLRKNFAWRPLTVYLRRWREPLELLRLLWKHVILRRPFRVSALYALPARADTN